MKSSIFNDQFGQKSRDSFDQAMTSTVMISAQLRQVDESNLPEYFFNATSINEENNAITAPIMTATYYFGMYAPEFMQENKQLLSDIQHLVDQCNQNTHGRSAQERLNTYRLLMEKVETLLENYRAAEKGEDVAPVAPVVASVPPADQVSLVAPTSPAVPTSDVRKGVNTSAIVVGTLLVLGGIAAAVASIFTLGTPLLIAGCVGAGVGAISTGAGIYAKVNEVPRAPIMHVAQQASVSATKDGAGKTQERVQSKSAVDLINSDKDVDGPKL